MPAPQQPKKEFKDSGLGYPRIEELLETEKFEAINKTFSTAYEQLEKVMKDKGQGLKKQKAAQKIMKSYELTTQLMNELLKIKYQILKLREEEAKKQKK